MDNFEVQDIKRITKEKIAVSNFNQNNNMRKEYNFLIKTLTSISACIVFSCGIIFSKQISTYIYDYAVADKEKVLINSADTAQFSGEYSVSNEEIIDLENNIQNLSQDNVKIKIEDITMDDNNLEVKFDIEFSDEISKKLNSEKGLEIEFEDLLITDENNNILVGLNENESIQLLNINCQSECQKNPNLVIGDIEKNILSENEKYFGGNLYSYVLKFNGKKAKLVYSMNLVGQEKYYPRCKYLNFKIEKIKILNDVENDYGGTTLNYQGKWNMNLELPDNIVNRTMISYKMLENTTLGENKVKYCNVLNLGTEIKLRLKAPEIVQTGTSPQLNLINTLEIKNPTTQIRDYFVDELMASDEYKKYEDDLLKVYMIQEAYIEDEKGAKYTDKKGMYSNLDGNVTEDGFYEPTILLGFKEEDSKENFKLHVTYCDVEYIFDLIKEVEN